ncbi:hypothetical protein HPP92_028041 [Vanilla planifolia]|uniref:Pentatricopeptide repeat-containing protein n=1 Tax=Vanilla planifolia TaxID=51239 RepID=A0A835U6L4_VANPL|nr:hypothetical protein HPP92_028041 [Vanilla planifolia]
MDCLKRFSESGRFSLFPGVSTVDAMKGHSRFYYTLVIGYSVIGCAERALQLFSRMRYYGIDLDYFGYHVLLNSLVEASYFEFADSIFDQINARGFSGPVTDCIRMKSLCCQGQLDDAALFLRQLYLRNHREVADRSVVTLVQALCKAGRIECARHFVEEFSNAEAYGALISFLLSARKVDVAMEILRKKKTKDSEQHILHIFHYNRLIQLLLGQNMLEEVCDVLVEMMEEGISPDQYTMDAALCFFCKAGMVDVVLELYDLKMELGMTPNRRAGKVEHAIELWKDMRGKRLLPNLQCYEELLRALCSVGNYDAAIEVIKDFKDSGRQSLLSSLDFEPCPYFDSMRRLASNCVYLIEFSLTFFILLSIRLRDFCLVSKCNNTSGLRSNF